MIQPNLSTKIWEILFPIIYLLVFTFFMDYLIIKKDYTIVGPLGRGSGSFVYKILSRKSKKEYVFYCNRLN